MLENSEVIRNFLKEKKGMSDSQITYFINEFESLTDMEKSDLIYEMVGREIYKENPVDIRTFINDPYFLGDIYGGCLFKIWRDLLDEIYPAPFLKQHDLIVLSCATRCFGKGTKILMYDGSIKNVEDIRVGDQVMGDDGTVRNVLSLTSGTDMLYKVIPTNDEDNFIICNANHTLPVYACDDSHIEVEVRKEYEDNRKYSTFEIKKYSYLKQIKEYPIYRSFRIEQLSEGAYYGFTLDGNHLFKLANGYIQHNCGKTYISAAILVYEIYLLTCMINPIKILQVANIVIACLSKDNATAVSQLCSEVYKCITQSPYFKGVVKEKLSFSRVDKDGVRITDDIILKAGSSIGTVIGTNLYAGTVDEINCQSSRVAAENLVEVRMKLYQEMFDRRRASYDKAPKMTGILMFTSSPTDEGDVLSEIIEDVKQKELAGDAYPLIRDNIPRWEAREEDTSETFGLFMGSDTKDPCVLDESIVLKPDELDRVLEVPIKYLGSFQADPYKSIQDIAGRRTLPETALFNSVASFEKVFYKDNDIFRTDTPIVSIGNGLNLDDFLCPDNKDYFSHPHRPECFRYIHLDLAYRCDKFGIASVYSDRVKYVSEEDGHEIYRRKYFVDFCLGIESKNKEAVDILRVLEFIYKLKEKGYPLKLVTTDNHQGELARQIISKGSGRSVKTEYLSLEKSKEQYLNMKNIILSEALEGYKNPPLMKDLRGLRESAKKIEKGKGYSDDMSNALAGALWTCSQDRAYKKNNEAITEIIKHTGKMNTMNAGMPNNNSIIQTPNLNISAAGNFSGMASRINLRKPNNPNSLGFNYRGF